MNTRYLSLFINIISCFMIFGTTLGMQESAQKLQPCKSTIANKQDICADVKTLSELATLKRQLVAFDASNTPLSDNALICILHANPLIDELILDKCMQLTDKSFARISTLQHLKKLSVKGTNISKDALLEILIKNLKLCELDLTDCDTITMDGMFIRYIVMEVYNFTPRTEEELFFSRKI